MERKERGKDHETDVGFVEAIISRKIVQDLMEKVQGDSEPWNHGNSKKDQEDKVESSHLHV